MRCVVTAGPTYEPLDQVRRLTNFSTGRLGIELAAFLTRHGARVTLLVGQQATWRGPREAREIIEFSTTEDLGGRLRALGSAEMAAVFHAAAVSDFAFGRIWRRHPDGIETELSSGKLGTRDGTLLAELRPTPKLLPHLRDWYPTARIVGWKYEVDGDRATALARAREQQHAARSDACVVNGTAYGEGFGLLTLAGCRHLGDREALYGALLGLAREAAG